MRDIRFTYGDDDSSVIFNFSAEYMEVGDMFMQWVRFMNAIGYVLDPEEMRKMWNDSK